MYFPETLDRILENLDVPPLSTARFEGIHPQSNCKNTVRTNNKKPRQSSVRSTSSQSSGYGSRSSSASPEEIPTLSTINQRKIVILVKTSICFLCLIIFLLYG